MKTETTSIADHSVLLALVTRLTACHFFFAALDEPTIEPTIRCMIAQTVS